MFRVSVGPSKINAFLSSNSFYVNMIHNRYFCMKGIRKGGTEYGNKHHVPGFALNNNKRRI